MSETTSAPVRLHIDCFWCKYLDQGDTLYKYCTDDVGITFESIPNIMYCPVCGRQLLPWDRKTTDGEIV